MKKLLERLHLNNDRARLLISICAVALVVVAAMLLPLAFRPAPAGEESVPGMTLEERTQMFAEYWSLGAEASGFTVTKPDPVPRRMKETSEAVIRTFIARSIDDKGLEDLSPTGTEFTAVSDGEREIHVCRMWLEKRGDWQNWLDICFDADTGELYYYYLSRALLTNRQLYQQEKADAAAVAEKLAEDNGWTLRYLSEGSDGAATALYSAPGGTLCYDVSCRVYDALIDVKLNCR